MKSKKINKFYFDLLNGKGAVSKVFEENIEEIGKFEIHKILSGFSDLLGNTFEKVRFNEDENGFEEALNIPIEVKERVQISILLFTMMALGSKYSQDLYTRVLKMRRELVAENFINLKELNPILK